MIQWFTCASLQHLSPISCISVGCWTLLYTRINVEVTTQLRGPEAEKWLLEVLHYGREALWHVRASWGCSLISSGDSWSSLWRSYHPLDPTSCGLSFQYLRVVVMFTLSYSRRWKNKPPCQGYQQHSKGLISQLFPSGVGRDENRATSEANILLIHSLLKETLCQACIKLFIYHLSWGGGIIMLLKMWN